MSCNYSYSKEVGSKLDMVTESASDKSCMCENGNVCSFGSISDGKSCKEQQTISEINDVNLAIKDLRCSVDNIHTGGHLSEELSFGHVSKDEYPQTEEISGQRKTNTDEGSVAAQPGASSVPGCILRRELGKSATFPCSRKLNAPDVIGEDKARDQCSQRTDVPVCSRSNSLPSSVKLVSAMKGGRKLEGIVQQSKPRVTWAADVVDPPVTSVSHTVRNQPRPKAKKDKRHKHGKGKSTHASSNGRKQHSKRSTFHMDNLHSRLEAIALSPPSDRMPADGLGESKVGVSYVDCMCTGQHLLEFAVASNDKCGSSFLRQAIGKVHLPFTEAT